MTQDQPRAIHLTDKHIVFGVMAASVVAVLAFLCGVFVGRGVLAVRPVTMDSSTVSAGIEPDPTPVSEAESPVPSAAGGAGSGSLPPGNLTYNDRLTTPELRAESIKAAVQPAPPSPALEEPPEAAHAAEGGEPRLVAGAPVPSLFTIQIAAVRSRGEAQLIVGRLIKKGYEAYVFVPPGGDRTGGFRVRVGSFKSRAEAEPTASRLQKEEQYKPWITR